MHRNCLFLISSTQNLYFPQVTDLVSNLSSSKEFTLQIIDVNDPPRCRWESGFVTNQSGDDYLITVRSDVNINTIVGELVCVDPDVKSDFRRLSFTILSG